MKPIEVPQQSAQARTQVRDELADATQRAEAHFNRAVELLERPRLQGSAYIDAPQVLVGILAARAQLDSAMNTIRQAWGLDT